MAKFVYKMLERPPGPGAQPREGLIDVRFCDGSYPYVWGFAVYNRELTKEEQELYSMVPAENIDQQ